MGALFPFKTPSHSHTHAPFILAAKIAMLQASLFSAAGGMGTLPNLTLLACPFSHSDDSSRARSRPGGAYRWSLVYRGTTLVSARYKRWSTPTLKGYSPGLSGGPRDLKLLRHTPIQTRSLLTPVTTACTPPAVGANLIVWQKSLLCAPPTPLLCIVPKDMLQT